jgi:hypothetical protein
MDNQEPGFEQAIALNNSMIELLDGTDFKVGYMAVMFTLADISSQVSAEHLEDFIGSAKAYLDTVQGNLQGKQ